MHTIALVYPNIAFKAVQRSNSIELTARLVLGQGMSLAGELFNQETDKLTQRLYNELSNNRLFQNKIIQFAGGLSMALNNLFDKAKTSALETANKVKETTKQAIDAGKDRIYEVSMTFLAEINGLKPILTECGFVVGDVNVTLPLVEVMITIEQTGQGKKTLEQILAEDKEKTGAEHKLSDLQKAVLNSMVKANDLAQITNRYGYTFRKYEVTMSTPPSVTIHLISNKMSGYND